MTNELACYIRLSHADDDLDENQYESSSVSNQRELIHKYLASHAEFSKWRIHEFVDDGYSGTTENRPEFQRMIRMVRQGQIRCIIVKDFSRFARNYITMGDYLEQIFPCLGVRFISINDSYDSSISTNISDNMTMVLKSILNGYYSRDLSAKMYSYNTQKMKNGEFVGTPCFGYVMNPERTHFIIDPDAAKIVREIFDLALSGKTRPEIVTILNNEGHPTPAEYNRQRGYGKSQMITSHPLWDHIKVSRILREPAYTGTLIMRKRVHVSPCSKHKRQTKPSEQFIKENAHEAIVTQEEFKKIQKQMPKKKGWNRENQRSYPLKGIARCGTCGKVMSFRISPKPGALQCPESILEHAICAPILFPLPELEHIVLSCLKPFLKIILQAEKKYTHKQTIERSNKCSQSINELKQQKKQLQIKKTQCYEEYVAGQLDLEKYLSLKADFQAERATIDKKLTELEEQEINLSYALMPSDLQQAADHAKQFANDTVLTADMVHSFIETIFIFDSHIEIRWKFKDLFEQFMQENQLTNIIQTENKTQEETI